MIKVTIIGSGNVAQHLAFAFATAGNTELHQVYSRKKEPITSLPYFDNIINDLAELEEADVYIIAVSDGSIAEISEKLPFKNRLVVHTSGSVPLDALHENNRKGVFYPLQTLTKNKEVDFRNIPICLEAEFTSDYITLDLVAKSISGKVFAITTQQRKSLHVSAVFVNNFVNHLYAIGNEICVENQVPFDILKPLIQETANKVLTLTPIEAQTGPAKRNDTATIESHLEFLSNENQKNIYKTLTQSIQNGKDL